jgi:alanine racemase
MIANRPTWAEVSLGALRRNFRRLQDHVGKEVCVCAVVKANAYGHGIVPSAQALCAEGARWLGVTGAEEGVLLRDAGISARILLMTGCWPGEEDEVVARGLTPVVWDSGQLERMQAATARRGAPVNVHVKVDTGMARLGVSPDHLPALLESLRSARHLALEGICSHLASAEVLDASDLPLQLQRFGDAVESARRAGFNPALCHLANTAATLARRDSWWNMVRPGISLYGYCLPFAGAGAASLRPLPGFEPVLSWKTHVLALRDVPAGQPVGYKGTFVPSTNSRLALLRAGYADGLNRQLSNRGRVILRGAYAPIVGRISMDMTLVDVTRVPGVEPGDEACLIGRSGSLQVDAAEHALLCHTIPYEILCNISAAAERRYLD